MKIRIIITFIYILLSNNIYSQIVIPYKQFIKDIKNSVVPIYCLEKNNEKQFISQGSSVTVGKGEDIFFLTCEHVLEIKDSIGNFVKFYDEVYSVPQS